MPPQRSPHRRNRDRAPLAELPISHFLQDVPNGGPTGAGGSNSKPTKSARTGMEMSGVATAVLGVGREGCLGIPLVEDGGTSIPEGKIRPPGSPLKPRLSQQTSIAPPASSSSHSLSTNETPQPTEPTITVPLQTKTPRTERTLRHRLLSAAGQEQAILLARSASPLASGSGLRGSGSVSGQMQNDPTAAEAELGCRSPARRLFVDEIQVGRSAHVVGANEGSGREDDSRSGPGSRHHSPPSLCASPSSSVSASVSTSSKILHPVPIAFDHHSSALIHSDYITNDRSSSSSTGRMMTSTKTSTSTSTNTSTNPILAALPESRRLRLAPSPPILGCLESEVHDASSSGGNLGRLGQTRSSAGEAMRDIFSPVRGSDQQRSSSEHARTLVGKGEILTSSTHDLVDAATASSPSTTTHRKVSARTHAERASPTSTPRASKKSKIGGGASAVARSGASPAGNNGRAFASGSESGSPRNVRGGRMDRQEDDVDMDLEASLIKGSGRVHDSHENADPMATGFGIWCDETMGVYASHPSDGTRSGNYQNADPSATGNAQSNTSAGGSAHARSLMSSSAEEEGFHGLWNAVASASTTRRVDRRADTASRPGSSLAATASPSGSSVFNFEFDNQENVAPVGYVASGADKPYFAIIKIQSSSSSSSAASSQSAVSSNPTSPSGTRRPSSAAAVLPNPHASGSSPSSPASPSRFRHTPSRVNHARSMSSLYGQAQSSSSGLRGGVQLRTTASPVVTRSLAQLQAGNGSSAVLAKVDDMLTPGRQSRTDSREGRRLMQLEAAAGL